MKVAIIGASSFIAKYIIEQFSNDDKLLLGRNPLNLKDQALHLDYNYPDNSFSDCKKYGVLGECEVIYYFAGAGIQSNDISSFHIMNDLNANEPINLYKTLSKLDYSGQLITFGSYFEIGICNEPKSHTEFEFISHTNKIPSGYASSKHQLTKYVIKYGIHNPEISWAHFVLPNVYGKGENEHRLFPYIIQCVKNNLPIHLGLGNNIRQFIHVYDLTNFLFNVREKKVNGIFHLSSSDTILVKDAAEMAISICEKKFNTKARIIRNDMSRKDQRLPYLILNDNLARASLGWNNFTKLPEGITHYFTHGKD